MIPCIRELARSGKSSSATKTDIMNLLSEKGFPSREWNKQQVTDVLLVLCEEVPGLIPSIISNGWVDQADRQLCIWAMAKQSRAVAPLLEFHDHAFMHRLMQKHPDVMKYVEVDCIPESQHKPMLELMGVCMHASFWTLCTNIIKKKVVSNEVVCEFIRRAIHVVDVSKCVTFLTQVEYYEFSGSDLMHYLAPMLGEYLFEHPKRLNQLDDIKASPIIIEELLARFRRTYPEITGCARKHALSLLHALDFRFLQVMPTHLRFMALAFPVECVERTNLFRRDEEIIRLVVSSEKTVAGFATRNIDFVYITTVLFRSLVTTIQGGWGVLMEMANTHLLYNHIGQALRLKLLEILLEDRFLHCVFMHHTREVVAMLRDGTRLVLVRDCKLTRPWSMPPINIHPVDLWSSLRRGECNLVSCIDRFLSTNGSRMPQRHEFYKNRVLCCLEHSANVKYAMQILSTHDYGDAGVTVAPLVDLSGVPMLYESDEPIMLLWPSGQVDYNKVNQVIQMSTGMSLISLLMNPTFSIDRYTAWLAFRVQPLFDWICPTFEACGLAEHPLNIIQVSHHVRTPHMLEQLTPRFSPWLFYNPFDNNPVGPRLMEQNTWIQNPMIVHLFERDTIRSGNQKMVALQHFGNMRTLISTIFRPELDMEPLWVQVLTHIKYEENRKTFQCTPKTQSAPQMIEAALMQHVLPTSQLERVIYPIVADPNRSYEPPPVMEPITRGMTIGRMLHRLTPEILLCIYKFLVRQILASTPLPPIRHIIPDVWWATPKQLLLFEEHQFSVRVPIDTVTNPQGVLLPLFQREIRAFVHGRLFSDFQNYVGVPFTEWPADTLQELPTSASLVLSGTLFAVHYVFSRKHYRLIIEPDYNVYKLHDLNRLAVK